MNRGPNAKRRRGNDGKAVTPDLPDNESRLAAAREQLAALQQTLGGGGSNDPDQEMQDRILKLFSYVVFADGSIRPVEDDWLKMWKALTEPTDAPPAEAPGSAESTVSADTQMTDIQVVDSLLYLQVRQTWTEEGIEPDGVSMAPGGLAFLCLDLYGRFLHGDVGNRALVEIDQLYQVCRTGRGQIPLEAVHLIIEAAADYFDLPGKPTHNHLLVLAVWQMAILFRLDDEFESTVERLNTLLLKSFPLASRLALYILNKSEERQQRLFLGKLQDLREKLAGETFVLAHKKLVTTHGKTVTVFKGPDPDYFAVISTTEKEKHSIRAIHRNSVRYVAESREECSKVNSRQFLVEATEVRLKAPPGHGEDFVFRQEGDDDKLVVWWKKDSGYTTDEEKTQEEEDEEAEEDEEVAQQIQQEIAQQEVVAQAGQSEFRVGF